MLYQLVFRGECTPGVDLQGARSNAMALFKASVDQVDRMFSGQRVVIRNKLDEAQVKKYQAVMRKHGMVAHIENMEDGSVVATAPKPESEPSRPAVPERRVQKEPESETPTASRPAASQSPPVPRQSSASVESGDRLPIAGDKVDGILAGSSLQVSAAHERLSETVETEAPLFEHLDEWTLAPAGSALTDRREETPVPTPDISHLSLEDDDAHH